MKYNIFAKLFFGLILSSVNLLGSQAQAAEPYRNGRQLYIDNIELATKESGFFVKVPVDYSDISKGMTEIYAHFRKPFDPALPTYVLFTGGPGQSSHFTNGKINQYSELGYNFLLFDQRGIAFSRPELESVWKNPDFHSSENNARDLEEIRKYLKIDRLSIYGASYGTVPATIYGNLFPNSTRSVILEGVVFDGFDITPQQDDFLPKVIQKYFDSLPEELKNKLSRISNDTILYKMWFPAYVQAYMTFSGTQSLHGLTSLLEGASKVDDRDFLIEFNRLQSIANNGFVPTKSLDEDLVNFLLMAKEFGFTRTEVITHLVLDGGKITRQKSGFASGYISEARNLGMPLDKKSTYIATNYPLLVPTYYINGARDGATIPPWVVKHWKAVPKEEAYLLLLKDGGHMPGGQIIKFDTKENGEVGSQADYFFNVIFKKALDGTPILKKDIEEFNTKGSQKFAFTSRESSGLRCAKTFQ